MIEEDKEQRERERERKDRVKHAERDRKQMISDLFLNVEAEPLVCESMW